MLASCWPDLASGSCLSPVLAGDFHTRAGHPPHPWHLELHSDVPVLQPLHDRGHASNLVLPWDPPELQFLLPQLLELHSRGLLPLPYHPAPGLPPPGLKSSLKAKGGVTKLQYANCHFLCSPVPLPASWWISGKFCFGHPWGHPPSLLSPFAPPYSAKAPGQKRGEALEISDTFLCSHRRHPYHPIQPLPPSSWLLHCMCVLRATWEVRYRGEPLGPESSVQEDPGPGAQWSPWALRIHPPCPLADFLLSPQKGRTSIPSEALGHCKGGDEPLTSPATLCPAPNPTPRGRWGLAASWKWEQRKTQRKQDFSELFCHGCASWHQFDGETHGSSYFI